jgi:molybdopterin-biosynthesis enzyme MoeA-like protein
MVMRAMLEDIAPRLTRGAVVHSATIEGKVPEGQIAAALQRVQSDHKMVAIGSYPFYRDDGPGAQFVVRGRDSQAVETAARAIEKALNSEGIEPLRIRLHPGQDS